MTGTAEILESKGKCYFKFCCAPQGSGYKITRDNCSIGAKCKPFVLWCKDGKNRFQMPHTYTADSEKIKYAVGGHND